MDQEDDNDFDAAELDTLTLAQKGVPMPVLDLRTMLPKRHNDGRPVTITLLGRQSDQFRAALHLVQTRRAQDRADPGKPVESENDRREREETEFLIACTVDWSIRRLDRAAFPCTPANIRKFWHDGRFRPLHDAAIAFIMGDANFLAPSRGSSDPSRVIISSSTAPSPKTAERLPTFSAATA